MIKLLNLINEEIEVRPPMVDMPNDDNDFIKQGFRTKDGGEGEFSTVEYLPSFEKVKRSLIKDRNEFQFLKFHSNENIAKTAKDLNTLLTKAANMVFTLQKMIELEQKTNK
jgi:hypothetical protein